MKYPEISDYLFALKTTTMIEPPCRECVFFRHETSSIDQDGDSIMCHNSMRSDFKCYRPNKVEKNE